MFRKRSSFQLDIVLELSWSPVSRKRLRTPSVGKSSLQCDHFWDVPWSWKLRYPHNLFFVWKYEFQKNFQHYLLNFFFLGRLRMCPDVKIHITLVNGKTYFELTARQNPPPPRLISASPVVRGERVFRQSLFGPRNALFKHLSWRSEDGSGYETLGSDRQPCELSVLWVWVSLTVPPVSQVAPRKAKTSLWKWSKYFL